jgi:hypothetical protein
MEKSEFYPWDSKEHKENDPFYKYRHEHIFLKWERIKESNARIEAALVRLEKNFKILTSDE